MRSSHDLCQPYEQRGPHTTLSVYRDSIKCCAYVSALRQTVNHARLLASLQFLVDIPGSGKVLAQYTAVMRSHW